MNSIPRCMQRKKDGKRNKFKREIDQQAVRGRTFTQESRWEAADEVRFGKNVELMKT